MCPCTSRVTNLCTRIRVYVNVHCKHKCYLHYDLQVVLNVCVCLGALVFLMIWFCFLWLWSIPIVILEFAAGRFTRTGPIESANRLAGSSFRFVGGWIIFVGFAIG